MPQIATDEIEAAATAEEVRANARRRLVLPRFLRKPARALGRADWKVPRHAGIKGLAVLFGGTALIGMIAGGHGATVVSAVTAWTGFGIEHIRIAGQSETSEVDILDSLAFGSFPSLLTIDIDAARARVEALPWVKHATLTKLYPDTLDIAVVEREPFALWQYAGVVRLIDAEGRTIVESFDDRYAVLPRVLGEGAAERIGEYMALIEPFPAISRRARAGVWVSSTRWTVVLDSGLQIMLPAKEPEAALALVARLDRDESVLSREVAALDLRNPDHLIVRLTEEGLAARKAALREREKGTRGRTST